MAFSGPNKHIYEFLEQYWLSSSPGYALFLNGRWGCGKTYLVNDYISTLADKDKRKFLYVSLYGLVSIHEIERAILMEIHPFLKSKVTKGAAALARMFLKATVRLDVEEYGQKGNVSANLDLNSSGWINAINECGDEYVLVFDDLERCLIPIVELLGYISSWIEHYDKKVVLLVNEDEVGANKASEQVAVFEKGYYRRVKEKIGGRSFRLVPDVKIVTEIFVNNVVDDRLRLLMWKNRLLWCELFESSSLDNLRLVKLACLESERLYIQLEPEYQRRDDLVLGLLRHLFGCVFEHFGWGRPVKDVFPEIDVAVDLEYVKNKPQRSYGFQQYDFILTPTAWITFFSSGVLKKDTISQSLKKTRYFKTDERDELQRLNDYLSLEDDELMETLAVVECKWQEKSYTHVGNILLAVDVFLRLYSDGVYPRSVAKIIGDAKAKVIYLEAAGLLLGWHDAYERNHYLYGSGFGGIGFGSKSSDFVEFNGFVRAAVDRQIDKDSERVLVLFTETLSQDFESAMNYLDTTGSYHRYALLRWLSEYEFVAMYSRLNVNNRGRLRHSLKQRYGSDKYLLNLEKDWIRGVLDQLEKNIGGIGAFENPGLTLHLKRLKNTLVGALGPLPECSPEPASEGS